MVKHRKGIWERSFVFLQSWSSMMFENKRQTANVTWVYEVASDTRDRCWGSKSDNVVNTVLYAMLWYALTDLEEVKYNSIASRVVSFLIWLIFGWIRKFTCFASILYGAATFKGHFSILSLSSIAFTATSTYSCKTVCKVIRIMFQSHDVVPLWWGNIRVMCFWIWKDK